MQKLNKLKKLTSDLGLDAILIKSKTTKKYLKTLTGSGVNVLITKENQYLILDGRYVNEAKYMKSSFEIIENTQSKSNKSHFDIVSEIFTKNKYSSLGIQANDYSILEYDKLKKYDFD